VNVTVPRRDIIQAGIELTKGGLIFAHQIQGSLWEMLGTSSHQWKL
jgi:hypothetical protein